jgi:putative endonuclease
MHFVKQYYVYIMTNRSKTLYTGVTSKLLRRSSEHKEHSYAGFTDRYQIDRLVYFEVFTDIRSAITREKQIKGWTRLKKIALIVSQNPTWQDLGEDWKQPIVLSVPKKNA